MLSSCWAKHSSEVWKSCMSCIFLAKNSNPCNPTSLSWQGEKRGIMASQEGYQLQTQPDLWELSKIWYSPPVFLCSSCRDSGLVLRSCGSLSYSINITQPWHWAHPHDQLHESADWQSTLKLITADHVWIACLFHHNDLSKENSIGGWRYFVVCGWNRYMLHTMHREQEELGGHVDNWKFPLSWFKPMLKACLVSGKVLKVHTSWASSHLSRFSSNKRLLMIWTKFWRRDTKEEKRGG